MPVIPWMVNSRRKFSGRFFMTMNGASIGPIFIFPVNFIDCRAFSLSRPPLAFMFLSMSSSAVCADADTASNAAAQSASTNFLCMGNPSFEVGRIEIFSHTSEGRGRFRRSAAPDLDQGRQPRLVALDRDGLER